MEHFDCTEHLDFHTTPCKSFVLNNESRRYYKSYAGKGGSGSLPLLPDSSYIIAKMCSADFTQNKTHPCWSTEVVLKISFQKISFPLQAAFRGRRFWGCDSIKVCQTFAPILGQFILLPNLIPKPGLRRNGVSGKDDNNIARYPMHRLSCWCTGDVGSCHTFKKTVRKRNQFIQAVVLEETFIDVMDHWEGK